MGCDIHLYPEVLINGKWVFAQRLAPDGDDPKRLWVPWPEQLYTERSYALFGWLSKGVRGYENSPFPVRGFPEDASAEMKQIRADYGPDGHSDNWLTTDEIEEIVEYLNANGSQHPVTPAFEVALNRALAYRIHLRSTKTRFVFWFDS